MEPESKDSGFVETLRKPARTKNELEQREKKETLMTSCTAQTMSYSRNRTQEWGSNVAVKRAKLNTVGGGGQNQSDQRHRNR